MLTRKSKWSNFSRTSRVLWVATRYVPSALKKLWEDGSHASATSIFRNGIKSDAERNSLIT